MLLSYTHIASLLTGIYELLGGLEFLFSLNILDAAESCVVGRSDEFRVVSGCGAVAQAVVNVAEEGTSLGDSEE